MAPFPANSQLPHADVGFPLFPKLPAEIQLMIWEATIKLEEPRILSVQQIARRCRSYVTSDELIQYRIVVGEEAYRTTYSGGIPPVLHASHEAQNVALQTQFLSRHLISYWLPRGLESRASGNLQGPQTCTPSCNG